MYLNLETRLAHLICIIYHTEVKQATSHSNQTEENTIGIQHAVKKSTLKSESMQHKKIKQVTFRSPHLPCPSSGLSPPSSPPSTSFLWTQKAPN